MNGKFVYVFIGKVLTFGMGYGITYSVKRFNRMFSQENAIKESEVI